MVVAITVEAVEGGATATDVRCRPEARPHGCTAGVGVVAHALAVEDVEVEDDDRIMWWRDAEVVAAAKRVWGSIGMEGVDANEVEVEEEEEAV